MPKRSRSKAMYKQKHLTKKALRKKQRAETRAFVSQLKDSQRYEAEQARAESRAAADRNFSIFEKFYYELNKMVSPEEWDVLSGLLFKPLPVSFRVCAIQSRQEEVKEAMDKAKDFLQNAGVLWSAKGREVQPPRFHKWCGAWTLGCDANVLRRAHEADENSLLGQLHRWLIDNNNTGILTRQEVVSMVPAAVLSIEPHHRVLDMCAAPGSKTTQALEMLHSVPGVQPSGFVVANEIDTERSYILANRCSKLGEAAKRLVVSSHRAQIFPSGFKFDRIICDVPCSGDGTFRKYRDKWGHWVSHQGRQLHALQLQIALRAATMLDEGGLMSYSTCSFNPVENEAVVAALLEQTDGALELVPCAHRLAGFKTRPGTHDWVVADDELRVWASYEETQTAMPKACRHRFRSTMWPSAKSRALPLERCLRMYPHLEDTGGFFVALLRKTRPFPSVANKSLPARRDKASRLPRMTTVSPKSCPYLLAPDRVREELERDLRLLPSFAPQLKSGKLGVLVARSSGFKRLFLLSPELSDFCRSAYGGSEKCRGVNMVTAGLCIADKSREGWTLTEVGARILDTYIDKPAEVEQPPAEEIETRLCTICRQSFPRDTFSRKQWFNGKSRKCVDCVQS